MKQFIIKSRQSVKSQPERRDNLHNCIITGYQEQGRGNKANVCQEFLPGLGGAFREHQSMDFGGT